MVGRQSLGGSGQGKVALRRELLAARAAMTAPMRAQQASDAAAALLTHFPIARGDVVALYTSFGTEPSTGELRTALDSTGAELLLPGVLPDNDLTWLTASTGADCGVDAIARCSLVVVPGLAADLDAHRLGRGGGSYDRALRRVAAGVPRVVLLYQDELRDAIPHEPHDAPVTHVALPDGVRATSAWLRS